MTVAILAKPLVYLFGAVFNLSDKFVIRD